LALAGEAFAHLERGKRYPDAARGWREKAIAQVRFHIEARFVAKLVQSSGYSKLDEEATELVHRTSRVPKATPGMSRVVTIPIRFSVR